MALVVAALLMLNIIIASDFYSLESIICSIVPRVTTRQLQSCSSAIS